MSEIDWKALAAPFAASELEWRPGHVQKEKKMALALPYIQNRAVMNRLDEIVGPANWKNEFTSAPQGGVLCTIYIRIGDEWVGKQDAADNTDIEGVKGGISDSMKRAAVQWGIGRYLYDADSVWHPVEPVGNSWKFVGTPSLKASNGHSSGSTQPPKAEQPAKPKSQTAAPDDTTPPTTRAALSPDKLVSTLKTKAANMTDVEITRNDDGVVLSITTDDAKALAREMENVMLTKTRQWILTQAFDTDTCKTLNPREAAAIRAWLNADRVAARNDAEGVKALIERMADAPATAGEG